MMSLNNQLLLKPYSGTRKIEKKVQGGFMSLTQRSTLVGLEILCDATITYNNSSVQVKKGQIAYFREELLFGQDWSRQLLSCDALTEECIIADSSYVVMVK